MKRLIQINPVTRISGFMEIDAAIEDHRVVDARIQGNLFRGFEKILQGRSPLDAVYFTQRICGICSTAHSVASSMALEDAFGLFPSEQGRFLRDFLHGCEFLQNHIRHFYQYTVPDFVRLPENISLYDTNHDDFRLPKPKNDEIAEHYFESLEMSRSAHEMLAVLGGKAPHNHGVFLGGITATADSDKIIKLKSILQKIRCFIDERMIPDAYSISRYYNDYYLMGRGNGNLLSYGCFNGYKSLGTLYLNPLAYVDGEVVPFDDSLISEEIDHSYYIGAVNEYSPDQTISEPDMNKPGAYSWVKAVRYKNRPFEVGPLARQWLSGEYKNGLSSMDRTVARVMEAKKISEILETLIYAITPGINVQKVYTIPADAMGKGLVDTTRGALGHWLKINKSLISFYQIITPSVWNLSSRGNDGSSGVAETALMDSYIQDINHPVELGRIIRSFDPCVSCATHVYTKGEYLKSILVMP